MWDPDGMTNSPCNVLRFPNFPIYNLFLSFFFIWKMDTRHSRGNWFLTITQLANFTPSIYQNLHWVISQSLFWAHKESEHWSMCYFETGSWHFVPKIAIVQPQKRTPPKRQLATHLKHKKIHKKYCTDCYFQAHVWQCTSNDGNRLAMHLKMQIQCPEPTPNYLNYKMHLKQHCRRPCQHAAGTRIREGNVGKGEVRKNRWKVKKQPETKLQTKPEIGRAIV